MAEVTHDVRARLILDTSQYARDLMRVRRVNQRIRGKLDVRSRLLFDTGQFARGVTNARRGTRRLGGELDRIGRRGAVAGTKAAVGFKDLGGAARQAHASVAGTVGKLVAVGAAYFGISMVTHAFSRLTRGAIGYTSELEKAQIGITGIIAAVDEIPFETAEREAKSAFDSIRKMSIATPATPLEMLDIFKGIIGPVRAAGADMSKVLDLTNKTTLTATALGVDFQQASRDINMMVRGAAGVDVKLFSLLKSTGAIKESTEEWNASLPPEERIKKLDAALSKFATPEKAAAFQRSWAGVSSTFKGIVQELGRAGFSPILSEAAKRLGKLNDVLLKNQTSLEALMRGYGETVARRLRDVSERFVDGFKFLQNNWGSITAHFSKAVSVLRKAGPAIAVAVAAFQGLSMAAGFAPLAGAIGGRLLGGGAAGAGAVVGGRSRRRRGGLNRAGRALSAQQAGDPFNALDFGAKGGMLFGGSLGLRGLLGMGGAGAAGAATTGGAASAAGAGVSAGAVAAGGAALAAALVAIGGVVIAAKDHWLELKAIFETSTGGIKDQFIDLWAAMKGSLMPVLRQVGNVLLSVLTPAFQVFMGALKTGVSVLIEAFRILGDFATWAEGHVLPIFNRLFSAFRSFGAHLDWLLEKLGVTPRESARGGIQGSVEELNHMVRNVVSGAAQNLGVDLSVPEARRGGTVVNNDFRGSRFQIKQEFGDDKDPDRILQLFTNDLTRQAEQRISSGFVPAFSR